MRQTLCNGDGYFFAQLLLGICPAPRFQQPFAVCVIDEDASDALVAHTALLYIPHVLFLPVLVRVLKCLFHGNEVVCTQVVSHVIAPPPPPLELEVGFNSTSSVSIVIVVFRLWQPCHDLDLTSLVLPTFHSAKF